MCFDLEPKFGPSSDHTRIRVGPQPLVKVTTADDNDDDDNDGDDDDDDEDGDDRRPWGTADGVLKRRGPRVGAKAHPRSESEND